MAFWKLFWGEQQATVAIVAVACIISGPRRYLTAVARSV